MTKGLEPCAYCGGETYLTYGEVMQSKLPMFKCKDCGAITSFDDPIPNAAMMMGDDTPAIKMFNTRYKRTCYPNPIYDHIFECSVCGGMNTDGVPNFCPNCGAEVVDGD